MRAEQRGNIIDAVVLSPRAAMAWEQACRLHLGELVQARVLGDANEAEPPEAYEQPGGHLRLQRRAGLHGALVLIPPGDWTLGPISPTGWTKPA